MVTLPISFGLHDAFYSPPVFDPLCRVFLRFIRTTVRLFICKDIICSFYCFLNHAWVLFATSGSEFSGVVQEEVHAVEEVDFTVAGVAVEEEQVHLGVEGFEAVLDAFGDDVIGDAAEGL